MEFPATIKPEFDFDEAICMTELSRRAYRVFESDDKQVPGEVYHALYHDAWQFVHSLNNYGVDRPRMTVNARLPNAF